MATEIRLPKQSKKKNLLPKESRKKNQERIKRNHFRT
jgi:hypothetical protein